MEICHNKISGNFVDAQLFQISEMREVDGEATTFR